jgi:3'-phosphoadenosine 5'-phosphosulfate sulfotransferase (PAPS reductase)/FAD synthetase
MSLSREQLLQRQRLSLNLKETFTALRIREWYEFWDGKVYVSFSGGKDSTVLLHQVRKLYPEVPAVFVDTGLEYPEIRSFVKVIDNVTWVRPKIPFTQVIEKYGYPVVSKMTSRFIRDLQNRTEKNKNVCNLRLTGFNMEGVYCPSQKLPKKMVKISGSPL